MLLNISKVLSQPDSELFYEGELDISDFELNDGVISFPDKVYVKLKIENKLQIFLKIEVRASLHTLCDRCAKSIIVPVKFEFESAIKIGNEFENIDDDVLLIDSAEYLDLKELVINLLVMNIPMKTLCRDDCKGLCPVCGNDLNISQCDCEKNSIDPRLEALKKLLDK